ncbi:hypothetical protein C823_007641 [Eubacterium plexicaudatum ASF492]|uniref:Uncharacterized protein n=1 Tax=Eubacterium plexicaudatum ASF492 TaxID=1235802 RepID=N2AAT3_9FIRM|nr:hypothetical protein C823_007641 [Eubacterium plexicaudatum ASF492]
MPTNQQGKNFAHELTLEYIRQNSLLRCSESDIPKQIDYIVKIENIICDCVEHRFHDIKFL